MTRIRDFSRNGYIVKGRQIRAIGWLGKGLWGLGRFYPKGESPPEVLERVKIFCSGWEICTRVFGFGVSCGLHICEFCEKYHSTGNCGLPAGELLYVFPEMLHHYMTDHAYRPPKAFVRALMASPLPGTPAFLQAAEQFQPVLAAYRQKR